MNEATRKAPNADGSMDFALLRADPLQFAKIGFQEFGDFFSYSYNGTKTHLLSHPADLQHVVQQNHGNYSKIGTPDLLTLEPLLGNGLMTAVEGDWSDQRQMLRKAFSQRSLESRVPAIAEHSYNWLKRWSQVSGKHPQDLAFSMRLLTLEIVANCLLGVELDDCTEQFATSFTTMSDFLATYDEQTTGADEMRQYHMARGTIEGLLYQLLAQTPRPDGILVLLREAEAAGEISTRDVRDQFLTLLVGGGETMSQALTWTLYLLGENVDERRALVEEIRGGPDYRQLDAKYLQNLPVTWRALQEAMRLYPPVWLMSRVAQSDDCIRNYEINAGDLLIMSIYNAHRHPAFWPDPDEFRPDRFLPVNQDGRPAYAYRPFSSGPRTCIGVSLAKLGVLTVLSVLYGHFDLQLHSDEPVIAEGTAVTLRPRHSLTMTLTEDA